MKKSKYYQIFQFRGRDLIDVGVPTAECTIKVPYRSFCALLERKADSVFLYNDTADEILDDYIKNDSTISIPYNAALRQILLLDQENGKATQENPLVGPKDPYYYLKTLLYIDMNDDNDSTKLEKEERRRIVNGIELEIDEKGNSLSFFLFERSASQQRQNVLVMINEKSIGDGNFDYGEGSPLYQRISCGLDNMKSIIASKFSAYRALMLTAGVCVDMDKTGITYDSIAVVPDFTIRNWIEMCKTYGKPVYSSNEKNIEIVCDTANEDTLDFSNNSKTNISKDALFDGEGLISSELCETITKMISEDVSEITSLQVRMPFVKGVLHSVDFKRIFCDLYGEENYDDLYLTDGFERKLKLSNIRIVLTFSMFKMNSKFRALAEAENQKHNHVATTDKLTGWDVYWEFFQEYNHSMFISGCNEIFSRMPDYTVSNYQFLSTLDLSAVDAEELVLPSLNSAWTSSQSSSSMAQNYILNSGIPDDDEDQDGDELAEGQLKSTDQIDVKMLRKCSDLINITMFRDRIRKSPLMKSLSTGHLIYPGMMKYLSGDLMQMICLLTTLINVNNSKSTSNNIAVWMDEAADVLLPEDNEFTNLFSDERPDNILELLFAKEYDVSGLSGTQRKARALTELVRLRKSTDFKDKHLTLGSKEIELVGIWDSVEPLERLKALNRQAVLNGLYTPFYYVAGAPKRRGVVDRNPHLTRNEHVVIDPPMRSKIRDTYFSHLTGVLMLRCAPDYFVQRLGGADFDGDIVRIFFSDAYIRAAISSLALNPLKIPSKNAKPEIYDDNMRKELIERSSGSRVGKFSNDAFRTSLLAYSINDPSVSNSHISISEQRTANETMVELSCVIGMEIDSAKTGEKPLYPNKRMKVYDPIFDIFNAQYTYLIRQERSQDSKRIKLGAKSKQADDEELGQKKNKVLHDPFRLSYFLTYKNIIKNNTNDRCAFLPIFPVDGNTRQYTLTEFLPYIFNPKVLMIDKEVLTSDSWAYLICDKLWRKNTKKYNSGEAEEKESLSEIDLAVSEDDSEIQNDSEIDSISYVRRIDELVSSMSKTRYLYELVENDYDNFKLSIEEMDVYCALRAFFQQISKKATKVQDGKRKTEVFKLLIEKYGEKASRSLLERMDKELGRLLKSDELVLDKLLDILPWKNLYSGEQRLLRFEKLAKEHGISSLGKNAALFEELCCQLEPNLRDDHLLPKIMLLNDVPLDNTTEIFDITEHDKSCVAGIYDSDEQKKNDFIMLCKAVYAENFVTVIQEMQDNMVFINADCFAESFYKECGILNIVLPSDGRKKELLDELVANSDKNTLNIIFAYRPEPYLQVRRIIEMRITGSKSGKLTPEFIPELDKTLKKVESLWQTLRTLPCGDFQQFCNDLYNEGDEGTFWLRQQDMEKRIDWFNKCFDCKPADDKEDVYANLRNLITILCEPSNWQLLPAYLNYARATLKTRERNKNKAIFNRKSFIRLYNMVVKNSIICTDRNEDDILEQIHLAIQNYGSTPNVAKPIMETVEDTVKCLIAWQETELDSSDAIIDTKDGFVVLNGLRIRIGTALYYSYIMNKYMNKRQKFSDVVNELFLIIDKKNTADMMLRKLLEFEEFSVTERRKRNHQKSNLDDRSDSIIITDKADSIERFIFRAYPEKLFNALKSQTSYKRVKDFEPDMNCGYLDGSQGIELAVSSVDADESSEDSKLPDMQLSIKIKTYIEDSTEKASLSFYDIIKESVELTSNSSDGDIAVGVGINIDHDREKRASFDRRTVFLYSIPFEVRIVANETEAVLKGAFSSMRLPLDSNGNIVKGYEDLASPITETIDLRVKDGSIKLFVATEKRWSRSVRVTKPIDSFICGYRKYKRTGSTTSRKDGTEE